MSIFDEKCKCCGSIMCLIQSDDYIYWCEECGTLLLWYDPFKISDDDWKLPNERKKSARKRYK